MQKKIYTDELFDGIERVYPDSEIVLVDPVKENCLICSGCGQRSMFVVGLPVEQIVNFDSKGNIVVGTTILVPIEIEKPFFLYREDCDEFDLDRYYEDEDEEYVKQWFALFEDMGEELYRSGRGPWCPNCGDYMGVIETGHDGCPGCNLCDCESLSSGSYMFCLNRAYNELCVPGKDCNGCVGNYARIKHKISPAQIIERVSSIRGLD